MEINLAQKAINFAINGNWSEAIKINLEILSLNPKDVDALNRLARAYAEIGKLNLAKSSSQKALDLDPVNPIALKSIEKWKSVKNAGRTKTPIAQPDSFLEESGKTKIVNLLNPGNLDALAGAVSGEEVNLQIHPHSISIVTASNKYLGKLPDDMSARLQSLIKVGNKYQTLIKSIDGKGVTVFIKEIEKGQKFIGSSSFPVEKINYVSFTPPELIHKDTPEIETSDIQNYD